MPLKIAEAISNGEEPQYLEEINIEALLIDVFEQWPDHEKIFDNYGKLSQVFTEFRDSKSCVDLRLESETFPSRVTQRA